MEITSVMHVGLKGSRNYTECSSLPKAEQLKIAAEINHTGITSAGYVLVGGKKEK